MSSCVRRVGIGLLLACLEVAALQAFPHFLLVDSERRSPVLEEAIRLEDEIRSSRSSLPDVDKQFLEDALQMREHELFERALDSEVTSDCRVYRKLNNFFQGKRRGVVQVVLIRGCEPIVTVVVHPIRF